MPSARASKKLFEIKSELNGLQSEFDNSTKKTFNTGLKQVCVLFFVSNHFSLAAFCLSIGIFIMKWFAELVCVCVCAS